MSAARSEVLFPTRHFRRQPAGERLRACTSILAALKRIYVAMQATPTYVAPLADLIADAAMRDDARQAIEAWKREHMAARVALLRARKAAETATAARSAVAMGQGWPAFAAPQDAAHALAPGVQTPYTPTAVPCPRSGPK
jgi:hypothetical protein